jgi:arylformamidase
MTPTSKVATRLVDLSLRVEVGTNPVYEGRPWLSYHPVASHADSVFESNCVEMFLHAGSHVDAPYHFDPEGDRIGDMPLEAFVGPSVVLDLSDFAPGEGLNADRLAAAYETATGGEACDARIALLYSGWADKTAPPAKEWWTDGPHLDVSAAQWLVDRGFTAVGFDFAQDKTAKDIDRLQALKAGTVKLAEMDDPPLPVHVILLSNGVAQIENIAGLGALPPTGAIVVAAPILLAAAEGAPARVFAMVP